MTNKMPASVTPTSMAAMPIFVGYLSLIVLVIGLGGWSITATISGAIIASGQIVVKQNRQVVQHLVGGVVGEILVSEGDKVKAGDVLLRLDDAQLKSELGGTESQYFELVARRGRLEAERDNRKDIVFDPVVVNAAHNRPEVLDLIDGQRRLFKARLDSLARETEQLTERKGQISAQIDGFVAQSTAQKKQLGLVTTELKDKKKLLAKGLVQASTVSILERETARLEGEIGKISASRAEAAGRMIEAGIGILKLETARREQAITRLRDLRYRELELSDKRTLTKRKLAQLDIRAPATGTVFGLQVFAVHSVVRAADPLMFIVPRDLPLAITSRVPPIHIDEVHVGQKVTLRFPAFDQRTTPELFGHVVTLSADSFQDKATQTSFYKAEIVPDDGEIDKLGGLELLPGMPVQAFIRTESRTPLSYLLKPVTDYFNKAFREG